MWEGGTESTRRARACPCLFPYPTGTTNLGSHPPPPPCPPCGPTFGEPFLDCSTGKGTPVQQPDILPKTQTEHRRTNALPGKKNIHPEIVLTGLKVSRIPPTSCYTATLHAIFIRTPNNLDAQENTCRTAKKGYVAVPQVVHPCFSLLSIVYAVPVPYWDWTNVCSTTQQQLSLRTGLYAPSSSLPARLDTPGLGVEVFGARLLQVSREIRARSSGLGGSGLDSLTKEMCVKARLCKRR